MEKPCTLLIFNDKSEPPQLSELKTALENGSDDQKIDALKKVVMYTLNGEQLNQVLMPIIRFVTPSRNHTIKKLLLLYWEVVEKTNPDGKLKSEMILVWYVFVIFWVPILIQYMQYILHYNEIIIYLFIYSFKLFLITQY